MTIILDIGSGNTCQNDPAILCNMIDEVAKRDNGKHKIIFKTQLFEEAPPNIPLKHEVFAQAYRHATTKGYALTSSVFDLPSLHFLLQYEIPFVKIACRNDLFWLIGEVPRKVDVIASVQTDKEIWPYDWHIDENKITTICCVPEYPADIDSYPYNCTGIGYSDHTVGLQLFREHKPSIWEKHLKLPDSTGPDAGDFAITPQELEEII